MLYIFPFRHCPLAFEVLKYVCTYTCRGITLNLGTLQKTVYLVVDIFAVLVTVVLGLVHKPSTFSPMANLFPGFSSLQQVQLHCGRNCLNLFQPLGIKPRLRYLPLLWLVRQSGTAGEHNDVTLLKSYSLAYFFLDLFQTNADADPVV